MYINELSVDLKVSAFSSDSNLCPDLCVLLVDSVSTVFPLVMARCHVGSGDSKNWEHGKYNIICLICLAWSGGNA